jgi:Tfp pilus assembly protein PilV
MELNKAGIKRKWLGMTLIEVAVASAIFAVTFGGMLVGQKMARQHAENSIVSFVIMHHAQGLLETIQSYDYHDGEYAGDATRAFAQHQPPAAAYNGTLSGIYKNESDTDPDAGLTSASFNRTVDPAANARFKEESLSLRYYPTTAGTTAIVPFTRNATFQNHDRLIGFEGSDKHSDSLNGIFKITRTDQMRNVFANFDQQTINDTKNGIGQEKYFYADDVDDFDGYRETQKILPELEVTFDISVAGIYDNETNFQNSDLTGGKIDQERYSLMKEVMSIANFETLKSNPAGNAANLAFDYYKKMLLKKITVLATWEYPPGSGKQHRIVIDGGKMNPKGDAQ